MARLASLAVAYLALTFSGTWACWWAAAALLRAGMSGPGAGALQLMGTMMPPVIVYALFPLVRACGLVPSVRRGGARGKGTGADDPRDGFLRFAFGCAPRPGGWTLFAALVAWRWAMFRVAFGFPTTPSDALASFALGLPALLLGGGLEEVGWRGVLQPGLERLLGGDGRSPARRVGASLLAPLLTGVIWAFWHLPLFATPGSYQSAVAFLPFLGAAVTLSYSFGALRATCGGTLPCVLAHAWYNAMLVAHVVPSALSAALFGIEALAGAAVLAFFAARRPEREARGDAG